MRQAHVPRDARFRFLLFSCCRPLKAMTTLLDEFPHEEKHLPSPIPSNTISFSLSPSSFSSFFPFLFILYCRLSSSRPTSFSRLLLRQLFHFLEIESEKRESVLIKSSNVAQGNELTSPPHFSTDLPSLNDVYIYISLVS